MSGFQGPIYAIVKNPLEDVCDFGRLFFKAITQKYDRFYSRNQKLFAIHYTQCQALSSLTLNIISECPQHNKIFS